MEKDRAPIANNLHVPLKRFRAVGHICDEVNDRKVSTRGRLPSVVYGRLGIQSNLSKNMFSWSSEGRQENPFRKLYPTYKGRAS